MKLLIPVGKSRGNILYASQIQGVSEFRVLLTKSLFRSPLDAGRLMRPLHPERGNWKWHGIDGPEEGPVKCRDSLIKWKEEIPEYEPDSIFVTASTNLIIAQLRHMFPKSNLICLRNHNDGQYLYELTGDSIIQKVEPLDAGEYLKIHGVEYDKSKQRLKFKGQGIPVDKIEMNGSRLSIRWKVAKDSKGSTRKAAQIGSFTQLLRDHCGPSNFEFVVEGKVGSNWINPNSVRVGEKWEEEE